MKRIALLAIILPAVLLCSRSPLELGGGSTSTGNEKVLGTVVYPSGLPASRAKVISRRSNYLPSLDAVQDTRKPVNPAETVTDSLGRFIIDSLDTGDYCIEVNDKSSAAVLFTTSLGPKTRGAMVLSDTLRPYATVDGKVTQQRAAPMPLFCRLVGLERTVRLDSNGNFSITDLPEGTYTVVVASPDTTCPQVKVDGITAAAGATTIVPFQNWLHSKRLYFNTTASGAGVAGAVTDFPALVRLTQNNFNFADAQDNGADLRFARPDGSFLPYEIERFDPSAQKAEVWVKIDTVFGNDSSHFITMYWGNPQAREVSNGPAVFDTADGYAAVWHLNLNCTDASYNKNDGVNSSALDAEGIVGYAKKFGGADSIKIAGLLGMPGNVTLSAWAQLDSVGIQGSEIVSLGDAVLIRMDDYRPNYGVMGAVHLYTLPGDTVHYNFVSGQKLKKTGWHLIALSVDATKFIQMLYIDGVVVRQGTSKNSVIDYTRVGQNTFIGKHGNGKNTYNFGGSIDEVRVSKTVLSADWMKLSFMNQKAQDMLIRFKQ